MLTAKLSRVRLDQAIAPHASKERTLEIGAYGQADYTKYFPNRTGVDIKDGPGVDLVGSVYELPFPDASFDRILCLSVLEHLEEPKKAIAEMARVLTPEGKIIVSVPFLFPIHDAPGDYWRFTPYGLKLLFKDWMIEELKAETTTGESVASLLQRIGYQTRWKFNRVMKGLLFLLAKLIASSPKLITHVYGDINRSALVPEAFASGIFLVAKKPIQTSK